MGNVAPRLFAVFNSSPMARALLHSRTMWSGVALLVVLALGAPAAANDAATPAPSIEATSEAPFDRYGLEVVASDVVAIGLTIAGQQTDHPVMRDIGLGIGVGSAPLIHLANRK